MKRLPALLALLCCLLLLVYSEAAFQAAADALALWWYRVLPALFPFYVLAGLLLRSDVPGFFPSRLGSPVLPCFLLGAVAGFPTGARLACGCGREPYAGMCTLCSPMFLLGVVSAGLCGTKSVFAPLAVSHYGSALLLGGAQALFFSKSSDTDNLKEPSVAVGSGGSLFSDIGDGMLTMLKIGGCIVFFYVLSTLCGKLLLTNARPLASALLTAFFEITSGCQSIARLILPMRVRLGLLAGCVSFGGICVFAQAMIAADMRRPARYLVFKLAQACLAALIAWLIAPLFSIEAIEALSPAAEQYVGNAMTGAVFLLSAVVGLAAAYLFAEAMKRAPERIRGGKP